MCFPFHTRIGRSCQRAVPTDGCVGILRAARQRRATPECWAPRGGGTSRATSSHVTRPPASRFHRSAFASANRGKFVPRLVGIAHIASSIVSVHSMAHAQAPAQQTGGATAPKPLLRRAFDLDLAKP